MVTGNNYKAARWGWGPSSAFYSYNVYNGGSNGVPQSFIIDNDGRVRYAKLGAFTATSQITAIVDELI